MVHDSRGDGQHEHHSLIENELYETMLSCLESFKRGDPAWTSIEAVLIDQDITEMAAIENAFAGIAVLLCYWHVVKYWQKELHNVRKYKITA
ncbi:TPA: hypothetical protein N0F65_001873 [Lagenidium giganteum]|uniref:ZSWIM1/3 RNaseH-like domain-containing protein n=1 Tax=Lagenidium giganteum TaxID=4803 RepID=A0AAV2Z2C2_9STRA|nr:TPA: hypothetical protein N0F65_001873 [Lagenidium giganteum]